MLRAVGLVVLIFGGALFTWIVGTVLFIEYTSNACYPYDFDPLDTGDQYHALLVRAVVNIMGHRLVVVDRKPRLAECDCAKGKFACAAICYDPPLFRLCWRSQ